MASRSNINGVLRDYERWLISLVDSDDKVLAREYSHLMGLLYDISYEWTLELDEDRAKDGIHLRHEYDFEYGTGYISVSEELYGVPCSVLEMLVALSLRCYDEFLSGFDEKKVSPFKVFSHILHSLGLENQSNERFLCKKCVKNVKNFMEKLPVDGKYLTVFDIEGRTANPHKMELWWQMQRYVDGWFE